MPSKSTESSVAARVRAYMMHRAEELKRERQARVRAAEKARKGDRKSKEGTGGEGKSCGEGMEGTRSKRAKS